MCFRVSANGLALVRRVSTLPGDWGDREAGRPDFASRFKKIEPNGWTRKSLGRGKTVEICGR